jgi:hypothetical protein
MKEFAWLVLFCFAVTACQKTIDEIAGPNNSAHRDGADSTLLSGDIITYEVITTDPDGWFGVWNDSTGNLTSNELDSVTYGSPIYLPTGWKYSFVCPSKPFVALISVANKSYDSSIVVNLYRNGTLIKSTRNDAMNGVTKLMVNATTDTLIGTATDPVISYEVLLTDQDSSKAESDGWIGQWSKPDGMISDFDKPLFTNFAIPSGWRYTFKPVKMPFTMRFAGSPYSKDGSKMTVNFYVNGRLVKTASARDWIYNMTYEVQ